jgi:hypothetical protein
MNDAIRVSLAAIIRGMMRTLPLKLPEWVRDKPRFVATIPNCRIQLLTLLAAFRKGAFVLSHGIA